MMFLNLNSRYKHGTFEYGQAELSDSGTPVYPFDVQIKEAPVSLHAICAYIFPIPR